MGGKRGQADDRGADRAPRQQPPDLLLVWSQGPWLRPVARAAFRIRSPLADRRVLRLLHAAGRLPAVRRDGGAGAVGRRQMHHDHHLPPVPGPLGETPVVARGGRRLPGELGGRVPLGETRGVVGPGPSGPERDRGHRRGRDPVATRAPLDCGPRLLRLVCGFGDGPSRLGVCVWPGRRRGSFVTPTGAAGMCSWPSPKAPWCSSPCTPSVS